MNARRGAALALILGVGGCSLIPAYHRPALPVSTAYPTGPAFAVPDETTASQAADIGWRDFFHDTVIQDLIALSLEHNRDLLTAAENVQEAEANFRASRASLFPSLDASAEGVFEREPAAFSGGFGVLHENAYALSLGAASYELDVFGRLRSLAAQAREQYLSSAETRESTQIALVAQVASEYLTWLADAEALRVSRETIAAQRRSYDLRVLTEQRGSGTALDVAQAESALRTAQASAAQYTRQEAQDMDEIVLLAGTPLPAALVAAMQDDAARQFQVRLPDVPAGLPSDLLRRRPDIRAAEHTLLAANANVGAARAAFFPEITLTGNGGTASGTLGGLFGAATGSWQFQPQISVPIFDAGKNFANLDIARLEKRVDIAGYEKTIQSAFHDVADALAARGTYDTQVQAEQQLVDADARYYTLSKMRFDAGVDNYLNVLVAQNSLFSAQLSLVSLRLADQQNRITLYKDLGGGWHE